MFVLRINLFFNSCFFNNGIVEIIFIMVIIRKNMLFMLESKFLNRENNVINVEFEDRDYKIIVFIVF